MDAVDLNYPVDMAAPQKLMRSDGCGGDRVTVMEVEVELCNSLHSNKDATSSANLLESMSLDKVSGPVLCQHANQLTSFASEDVSKQCYCVGANSPSWVRRPEEVQLQRKVGQVSRSGSGCSKRPRIVLEDTKTPAAIDDTKDISDKLGSNPTKCDSHEKTQLAKQKNNLSSKRGERRNCRVSNKGKSDSFSVKASLASFSSAAAGNNFFGLYGLKTDVHDITKLVDELSLSDLLQGAYECPRLGKDKGKKATNSTEKILHSVRKACSILQLPRSIQLQNSAEIDNFSSEKIPICESNSVSIMGNECNCDLSTTEPTSSNKDFCCKFEALANLLNFPFDQPKNTLERLALPPPKDLESLLVDAAKPTLSSRNAPDPRPGKQISRRPSLPPFPWSHTLSGHSRTNSDVVKLLTSKSTCQGRWVKMGNTFNSPMVASNQFTNLASFTYNETLVPSCGPKLASLENDITASTSVPWCEQGSSIVADSMTSYAPLSNTFTKESGVDLKNQGKVEHCPRLLAAAQTLYDIATYTLRLKQDGMTKWPKPPSQKAMQARKSKSNEKPEEIFASSTSIMGSNHMVRSSMEQTLTSKRPKLSIIENKKEPLHIYGVRRGSLNWSTPKSSRSSPNKSVRDSTAYIVRQSCMMPQPAKVLNKACNGQQKVRKLMRMDWNWECDRQD